MYAGKCLKFKLILGVSWNDAVIYAAFLIINNVKLEKMQQEAYFIYYVLHSNAFSITYVKCLEIHNVIWW